MIYDSLVAAKKYEPKYRLARFDLGKAKLADRASRSTMLAAFISSSSGLVVGGAPKVQGGRMVAPQMATVLDTLSTANGPEIFWGPDGPLQDPMKEESDFKEYDSYSMFVDACKSTGVDLTQPGITVFAPANVACAEFGKPLTKEICEYHVVKGEVSQGSLGSTPLTTLEGGTITYRRMFRKDFIDNAFCGVMSAPPRSSYKADIKADNGLIHMINEVIYPGWSVSSGGYGSEGDAATRA